MAEFSEYFPNPEKPALNPEDADKLLANDLRNIIAKIEAGETITIAERKAITDAKMRGVGAVQNLNLPEPAAEPQVPVFADTQEQLAKALCCDRKTIQRLSKVRGCPGKDQSTGKYNVGAWKIWCVENGHLKGRVATSPAESKTKADYETEQARLNVALTQLKLDEAKGKSVSFEEAERIIGEMLTFFIREFNSIHERIGVQLAGLNPAQARSRLIAERNRILETFSIAEWAKKKAFWQNASRSLDAQKLHYLTGNGQSSMS